MAKVELMRICDEHPEDGTVAVINGGEIVVKWDMLSIEKKESWLLRLYNAEQEQIATIVTTESDFKNYLE